MPPATSLSALNDRCEGEVVAPGDPDWDSARAAWNLAVDQRPAAIVIAASDDDVAAAVSYAAAEGLRVAAQGTGHAAAPLELDGALLLKTSRLTGVEVDPGSRRAKLGAGTLAADLAAGAGEHGLAPLGGSSPDVGACGYALGGGCGWLARELGLQCGAITAAEVVLADGSVRQVDDESDPELIWALRGGGGSFGIVTSIEVELHELPRAYAGALAWEWSRSAEVLDRWREWTAGAPECVTTSARMLQLPPIPDIPEPLRGRQLVMVDGAVTDTEAGEEILAPLRELGPEIDTFEAIPTAGLCRIHGDPEQPVPGAAAHAMLSELEAGTIEALVDAGGPGSGSPLLFCELRHLGGALQRPSRRPAALSSLEDPFAFLCVGMVMDAEMGAAVEAHAVKVVEAIRPWTSARLALNWTDTRADPAVAFDAESWQRLRSVKSRVDPDDVILANHPIPPA